MENSSIQANAARPAPCEAQPVTGWALNNLAHIEGPEHILRFTLYASNLRRQAIFMALSTIRRYDCGDLARRFRCHKPADPWHGDDARDVSTALIRWRAREIVCATWGSRPKGIIGALVKIGPEPLTRLGYLSLFRILGGAAGPERAAAIQQCGTLDDRILRAVRLLDPIMCRPGVLQSIDVEVCSGLNAIIDLARRISDATDEAIAASLQNAPAGSRWNVWASRWLGKAKRFPRIPPINDDDEIIGLHSAEMMREAGTRFKNCLRTKISGPTFERSYYFEYKPTPAIVELQSLSDGYWLLHRVYGPSNNSVNPEVVAAIWKKIKPLGILAPAANSHASRWSAAAKLIRFWDFDPECDFVDFGDDDDLNVPNPAPDEAESPTQLQLVVA